MAKSNVKVALALAFSLLLLISVAESKRLGIIGVRKEMVKAAVECDSVYGAELGDTCDGVAKKFKLSPELFAAINPNINCDKIFVGQWLCVDGSA